MEIAKKKKYNPFSIEKSMAGGVDQFVDALIEGSLKLSKKDIRMYVDLIQEPFFEEDVKQEILLMKFEKGFFAKHIFKAWEKFTGAFQSIYYNKRIQKALRKSQGGLERDW